MREYWVVFLKEGQLPIEAEIAEVEGDDLERVDNKGWAGWVGRKDGKGMDFVASKSQIHFSEKSATTYALERVKDVLTRANAEKLLLESRLLVLQNATETNNIQGS